jgi:hypothetical protein
VKKVTRKLRCVHRMKLVANLPPETDDQGNTYFPELRECSTCGFRDVWQVYRDLLTDIFSIPATRGKKGGRR